MYKLRIIGICIVFIVHQAIGAVEQTVTYAHRLKKVVIDAGHGGHDGGCKGGHMNEKEIALQVALLLGKKIEQTFNDVEVIYTRKTDVFIPLNKRTKIANDAKADLFISIHCNSMPGENKHIKGTEVYVMGAKSDSHEFAVEKRENSAAMLENNYEAIYPEFSSYSTVGRIILNEYLTAFDEQSLLFAQLIHQKVKNRTDLKPRGVKRAGFVVLRQTAMPGVLVETGYLTNESDNEYLSSIDGMEAMASALFEAFTEYKIALEYKQTPSLAAYHEAPKTQLEKLVVNLADKPKTEISNNDLSTLLVEENKVNPELVFKVQLGAAPNDISTTQASLQKVKQLEVFHENGMYKFLTGRFLTYQDAATLCKKLKTSGYKDAFIVAYINGTRVSVSEAMKN